jgi:predicted nuclease with TOPRIM domain
MQKSTTQISLLTLTSIITILCISCGGGRVAQCNRIVKVANQGAELGKQLSKMGEGTQDAESLVRIYGEASTKIEQLSKNMKELDISDQKLKGFQSRFFNMYQDAKKSFDHLSSAVTTRNMTLVYQSSEELKIGTSREHDLVIDINKYCAGK